MRAYRNTGTRDQPIWEKIMTTKLTPPSNHRYIWATFSDGTEGECYYPPYSGKYYSPSSGKYHRWQVVTAATKRTPAEFNWVPCEVVSWREMQGAS